MSDLHIPPVMCCDTGTVVEVLHYRALAGVREALVRVEHPGQPVRVRIAALADITVIPITSYLIGGTPCPT